jgi:hypothetical protein
MATPPNEFVCPINLTLMSDPVIGPDGHSYERRAITQWLRTNPHSPLTRQPMTIQSLQTNYSLRSAIERYNSAQNSRRTTRAQVPTAPVAVIPMPSAPPGDYAYAVQMQSNEYAQPLLACPHQPQQPQQPQQVVVIAAQTPVINQVEKRRRNLLGACACLIVVIAFIIILTRMLS